MTGRKSHQRCGQRVWCSGWWRKYKLRYQSKFSCVTLKRFFVGKTTVLKAYELFGKSGEAQSIESFYQRNEDNAIEMAGIFSEISEEDKKQIGEKWIYHDDEYGEVIKYKWKWNKPNEKWKKFSWNESEKNGKMVEWVAGTLKLLVVYQHL